MSIPRLYRALTGCILAASLAAASASAQPVAFSGADGAGALATGGRGGIVYHVTQLDRNFSDSGPGTLRYGLNDANFTVNGVVQPRTIVFDVGGVFWLGRFGEEKGHDNGWDTQSRLNLGSNVTIAGQTAPGGVYIMGGVTKANGSNVIMRHVTLAPGYGLRGFAKPEDGEFPQPGDFPDSYVYDALDISGQNMIFDHLTALYATDETISANETADDITIQYSIIAQGQNYPQADAEASGIRYTGHGLGSLFQMGSNANLSVHHNLYAHLKGRLPRVGTPSSRLTTPGVGAYNDFRNNVFYNWYNTAGTGASGQPSQNNFISNFYLAGPGGDDVAQLPGDDGILGTVDDVGQIVPKAGGVNLFNGDGASVTGVHHAGNVKDINKDGDPDDAVAATNSDFVNSALQASAYTQTPYLGVTENAVDAFYRVLAHAGAFAHRAAMDPGVVNVDSRLADEVLNGTGQIMAWADDPFNDDPAEGAEWRALLALRADPATGAAPFARPAGWDSDGDGMPDHWEQVHGLNLFVQDHNGDFDADGYTNLEEYLNELAAFPAPIELRFTNALGTSRYEQMGNWTTGIWQPSRFDAARIAGGIVTVNSVGQHAGALRIVEEDGPAELHIADGWLIADQQLWIGDGGTLRMTGGVLHTVLLDKTANGDFVFTGGSLHADVVAFNLVNQGGTLAPGHSIGLTHVLGDLALLAGILQIELAGDADVDQVLVDGTLTLGGDLEVTLLDGYVPDADDRWLIASAQHVQGAFASVTPGYFIDIDGGDVYLTTEIPEPASLAILAIALLSAPGRGGRCRN